MKKKIWANFQRISSQKYGFGIRDPGSGKNLFRIPDTGVKKAPIPDPGSGSATLIVSRMVRNQQLLTWRTLKVYFSGQILTKHYE
jgi:hypothetical protein